MLQVHLHSSTNKFLRGNIRQVRILITVTVFRLYSLQLLDIFICLDHCAGVAANGLDFEVW